MFESLVSSKIRRTLFEYLLQHPHDRFYLRGLAKELGLSITPLRRELKRLVASGILQAIQEGNIVFYTINLHTPAFLQLQQAGFGVPATPGAVMAVSHPATHGEGSLSGVSATAHALPMESIVVPAQPSPWFGPLREPIMVGVAIAGMALMIMLAGLLYLTVSHEQFLSRAARLLSTRKAEVAVVAPQPSASGVMRGSHWQVVPGGFGGFSSGSSNNSDSY